MSLRLKIVLVVSCLWSAISCAGDNYAVHPAAIELVDELVQEETQLVELKHSLEQMEQAMLMRLWRLGRGQEVET